MRDAEIQPEAEVYSAIIAPNAVRTLESAREALAKARQSRVDVTSKPKFGGRIGQILSVFGTKERV
jgi:hypothetical protein